MLKLNLGAGNIIFPLTREQVDAQREGLPEWAYHIVPLHDSAFKPGLCNVDKYLNPGIDERVNLFRFPWIQSSNGQPWLDNSVDEIFCSHLIEHIPHEVKMQNRAPLNWRNQYEDLCENLDG